MEKYKVCPSCSEHNSPAVFECISCGTDLMSVRVVDEGSERLVALIREDILSSKPEMKRLCDCGAQNPAIARKCSTCGEEISDIQPTHIQSENVPQFNLASLDGSFAYAIDKQSCTIGREEAMKEYLSSKPFVSRIHAKFTIVGNELFVTNLSQANGTFINNKRIVEDVPQRLGDGDELGLGGFCRDGSRQEQAAYFVVRIGSCI